MTTSNELMLIGVYAALCPALLGATVIDWRTRMLPNPLVLFIALTGLLTQAFASGLIGGVLALFGALIGFAGLLPFYVLGGMAAGDVKLMAAVSAWFSLQGALLTVLLSILAGGVLGLLFIVARRRREGLPYATAITAGTFASLIYTRSVL